jgi:hypothetical protein
VKAGVLPDAVVLPRLREMAVQLRRLGMHDAEMRVRQAIDQAPADPATAAQALAEAAELVAARAPEARRA